MAKASPLSFPSLPPWPPSWGVRAAYLQWWLCCFMTGVGGLKAAGFLKHDLSQIVGIAEIIGGLVFLPRWPRLCVQLGITPESSLKVGACFILAGLGIIASTHKRKSPICWSQALLTIELLRERGGNIAAGTGAVAMATGTVCGMVLGVVFLPSKSL